MLIHRNIVVYILLKCHFRLPVRITSINTVYRLRVNRDLRDMHIVYENQTVHQFSLGAIRRIIRTPGICFVGFSTDQLGPPTNKYIIFNRWLHTALQYDTRIHFAYVCSLHSTASQQEPAGKYRVGESLLCAWHPHRWDAHFFV